MSELGSLEKLPSINAIWANEARDFTRKFLVDDGAFALLGAALGYGSNDLEVEAVEKQVGSFRADLILRETGGGSDSLVLVENQFGSFDHDHLGKTITYAGGLSGVKTVVWVAEKFRDDHLAAITWLNDVSREGYGFFALEIELWKIGDSKPAPRFNAVARPNEWEKAAHSTVTSARELTETQIQQREYWTEFEDQLAKSGSGLSRITPGPYSWTQRGIGKGGVTLNASMNTRENWVRCEIYLSGTHAQERFALLLEQREAIEEELGYALDWQDLNGADRRICLALSPAVLADREDWPRQHRWLVTKHIEFFETFATRARGLPKPGVDQ